MTYRDRIHCGAPNLSDVGREVLLAGWVDALRDHGEVLFIHLRDRSGVAKAIGFLIGQAMQALKGKGNPKLIRELLTAKLDECN